MAKQWFPLESNPQVMNTYVSKMGLDTSKFSFQDVFSVEDWALSMIPRPVVGVLLLYPIKPESESYRESESNEIDLNGQIISRDVFYMKQTVGNACGTVGILHALANARNHLSIQSNSYLDKFLSATASMTPDQRAEYLENDETLEEVHESAAAEGQSEQQDGEVDNHFVCVSLVNGHIYELDGRKKYPINHGESSESSFLEDACKVVQKFMDRDPGELRFTIVALANSEGAAQEEDN